MEYQNKVLTKSVTFPKCFGINSNALCTKISSRLSEHKVAELEFYTWGGQGVAKANSGGPYKP